VDKVLQVKLDQDFDTLEILSLAIFPNDVYLRNCATFGTICGRVFCNRGLGLPNARVSIFIPIEEVDESNPLISSVYPYKSFEDFNEDGYKFNLLPYSQSHSGHVPVGTFPDRVDALTDPTVVEIYDKYYKFTSKTNDSGDYMIFGIPIGEYDIIMQVDLSDIGEFSLLPQDLLRMGLANESQLDGTRFKFSENYSELPQIVTLKKVVQIAPFYGQKDICDHYITRADFDLTSEAGIELKPTAVFMGSVISSENRKKLKRNCRVPAKQGWLCNLVAGPGQIETVRHTIFSDNQGRPILEEFRLENDGKLIDENGTWLIELPMNLDFVYTDEDGIKRISTDGERGVPTKSKYRFKVKWQQSPQLSEENRRGYFLVPNIKEWGWSNYANDPNFTNVGTGTIELPINGDNPIPAGEEPSAGPFLYLLADSSQYYNVVNTNNIETYTIVVDGVEEPNYTDTIPMGIFFSMTPRPDVYIKYTLIDPQLQGILFIEPLTEPLFQLQSSYAFSVDWTDYGTPEMIQEAIDCVDRFYEFKFNKVYTVSSLIDRYSNRIFPQKSIQIKHIIDSTCEGINNPFPTNDAYYRFDILYILFSFVLTILKPIGIIIIVIMHVLAWLWPLWQAVLKLIYSIQNFIYKICKAVNKIPGVNLTCTQPTPPKDEENPFTNLKIPLFLYTEDGCERCRCKLEEQNISGSDALDNLLDNIAQLEENNTSLLADFPDQNAYNPIRCINTAGPDYDGLCGVPITDRGIATVFNNPEREAQYLEMHQALIAGSNTAEEPRARRFPIWIGSELSTPSFNIFMHSDGLPIAERLNLFNTKAKYFDNLNPPGSPGTGGAGTTITTQTFFGVRRTSNVNFAMGTSFSTYGTSSTFITNYVEEVDIAATFDPIAGTFTAPQAGTYSFSYSMTFEIVSSPLGRYCFDDDNNLVSCVTAKVNITDGFTTSSTVVSPFYMSQDYGELYPNIFGNGFLVQPPTYTISGTWTRNLTANQTLKLKVNIELGQVIPNINGFANNPGFESYEYDSFNGNLGDCVDSTDCDFEFVVRDIEWTLNSSPEVTVPIAATGVEAGYKLSPGNTGWNQARVQWASDRPANANKFHYDNMIVLLVNNTGLTEGDMISFTSASVSKDKNKNKIFGIQYDRNTIRAKYANPIYGDPNPLLITTYQIDDTPPEAQRNVIRKTPYAIDIEYFQVVKQMDMLQYFFLTGNDLFDPFTTPPNNDVRFSLPWRFLRSHLGPEKGNQICNDTDYPYMAGSSSLYRNGNMIYQTTANYAGGWACNSCAGCRAGNTYQKGSVDPIRSYTAFTEGFSVVFLQRGVDPHSPRINIKYDLRRFFGINNDYNLPAITLYGVDITNEVVVEGMFRVNIPIQPGGEEYGEGTWEQNNPHGLRLIEHNTIQNNNDSTYVGAHPPVHFESQFFTYDNPDNDYIEFSSTTLNYYSALDRAAVYQGFGDEAYRWNPEMPRFAVDLYTVDTTQELCLVRTDSPWTSTPQLSPDLPLCVAQYPDDVATNSAGPNWAQLSETNQFTLTLSYYCSTTNGNVYITEHNFAPDQGNNALCPGSTRYCCDPFCNATVSDCRWFRHCPVWKHKANDVSGYWYREYVEGGSCLGLFLYRSDNPWPTFSVYGDFNECENPGIEPDATYQMFNPNYDINVYWSPVYAGFTETEPRPDFVNNFFGGDVEEARKWWYVNPRHTITYSNKDRLVIRTDRLPSSTNLQNDGLGASYIMHQNSGFLIVVYEDLTGEGLEEGTAATVPYEAGGEVNFENLPGGTGGAYAGVTESLVDCTKAVDLNSYGIDPVAETPFIYEQDPFSREPANDDKGDWWWFVRGMGCYNFVSRPFSSLKPHGIGYNYPDEAGGGEKKYSDIYSLVELIQRLKLTFALCFEVISHTFSNGWVNGTLYAFAFQNSTFFDSNNLPYRSFCRDVVLFHKPLKNYYYRSSPWNGTDFIGKRSPIFGSKRGNLRNLLFPTTVMDLGPKASFIQELVFSDEYDGFISAKLQSTSFQDVTDILNVFVLTRLVNATFLQMLIPLPDDNGNEQGSDDPSVGSFFANSRWENGTLFFNGLLPGLMDADYSQLVSINSEFGVVGFGPESYSNNALFFGIDDNGYSVLGLLFSGSNQDRDYISPRRTIWREFASLPEQDEDFTYISIKTQTVPFHQWTIFHEEDQSPGGENSIFGYQSNNFVTEPGSSTYTTFPNFPNGFFYSPYQSMDRFNGSSNYFRPETNNTFTFKGFISNSQETVNPDGTFFFTPTARINQTLAPWTNGRYTYSVGSPFHFYFGLINGGSALDRFVKAYIDTNIVYE
jgi:hypothetical protein